MPGLRVLRKLPRVTILLMVVLFSSTINAQVCNGSLGDPAVDLTFGSGNPAPSSFVPSSSYIFQSATCPNDGYYTITNYSSDCFGDTWHTVTSDHTGGGGNFMLVNASYDPGDFFVDAVTDLCPNTTYEFAAWVLNIMKPVSSILPNLTFSIQTPTGVLLAQFDSGDIPVTSSPTWKQYGFFFTTPATNATIILRITNNAPGGYGNDLALDDITFRPCGEKVNASIQGNSDTINVCEGNTDSYSFNSGISSAYLSPVFQWQESKDSARTWQDIPGAVTSTYLRLPTGAGSYWYRLTVTEASSAGIPSCRIASDPVVINVHAKPIVDAGPDRVYIVGYPVTLYAIVNGETPTYLWSPNISISDITVLNPEVSPAADITYILSASSSFCSNEDSVHVKVVGGIYVPTAFTPNGDGKNDTWNIPFLDPSFGAEVSVFNRWGQLVYHTDGEIVSWDGTVNGRPQATGTYVYVVVFKNAPFKMMKGIVNLIR